MPAEILHGVVKIGRPSKVGGSYVLIERTNNPENVYFRLSTSRQELTAAKRKRLTLPPRKP